MPKRRKCCIKGCPGKEKNFFNFPNDEPRRSEWESRCVPYINNFENLKRPLLCKLHFEEKYIAKKKLYPEAVPTLHLNNINDDDDGTDFEVEELNQIAEQIPNKNECFEFETCCNSCHKREENLKYYRSKFYRINQKYTNLLKKLKLLRHKYKILKKTYTYGKNTIQRIRSKYMHIKRIDINEYINKNENISSNAKTFCKMLLRKTNSYSKEERELTQAIFFKSNSVYRFLKDRLQFHFPSISSLYTWLPFKNLSVGRNTNLFQSVKKTVEKLNLKERQVVLIFDEMKIKKDLAYSTYHDKIEGYADYGIGEDSRFPKLANYVLVFMARSLHGSWSQIISFSASERGVSNKILQQLVEENIKYCESLSLEVRSLLCDQATSNQKLYDNLGTTMNKPFFVRNSKKIYCLYDFPHITKCFRNNLRAYDLEIEGVGTAKWAVIRELFQIDRKSTTRVCPKLSFSHIDPDPFEKMRVKFAVQIFSRSTSDGIKTMQTLDQFPELLKFHALPTAILCEKLNNVFDSCNSNSPISKNPYRCALAQNNLPWNTLKETKNFLQKCKFIVPKPNIKINCIRTCIQTIEGILQLSTEIFAEFPEWKYLCTKKLNQDPLENVFSKVRFKRTNPGLVDFATIISRVISLKFITASFYANCEQDEDDMLEIDWDVVLQNTSLCFSINKDQFNKVNTQNAGSGTNNVDHEQTEESDCFNGETFTTDTSLSDNALTYFCGYIMTQMLKRGICKDCQHCKNKTILINPNLTSLSQTLVSYKNYKKDSDFGNLNVPTDEFFNLIKEHIVIITNYFKKSSHIKNLMQKMCDQCIDTFPTWYDINDNCYFHRVKILEYLALILIRKLCKWEVENKILENKTQGKKRKCENIFKRQRKLKILQS